MTCVGDACGTLGAYVGGCRGEACRDARAAQERDRRRAEARPDVLALPASLPAGQVRTHLALLRDAGLGTREIASRSGVARQTVQALASGRQQRTTARTKDQLLAVMPSSLAQEARVPARVTQARLEDLLRAGWSRADLARLVFGRPWAYEVNRIGATVTARTEARVRELHAEAFPPDQSDVDPLAMLRFAFGDRSWRDQAECARLAGDVRERQAPFFPTRGEEPVEARAVCQRCPVIVECLDFALETAEQGVWGDTTGGDRRLIRHLGLTGADVIAMRAETPDRPLLELLMDAKHAADTAAEDPAMVAT